MYIDITLDGTSIPVERTVFTMLFEQSVARDLAAVRKALASSTMKLRDLVLCARKAEIPYPLFFAPLGVVEAQLKLKKQKLMAGFTKEVFSMNSRNRVEVSDVELIVKDLMRKQHHLKKDENLGKNLIVNSLKRPQRSVQYEARQLMDLLEIGPTDIRSTKTKEGALDLLIGKVEAQQIFVSRSVRNYMPQQIPKRAKFSGLTLKDSKIPFIFLSSGDEGENLEPSGRRVFTLSLLTVLIARGTFAPVTYSSHTAENKTQREYSLTAEILMPAADIRRTNTGSLDSIKETAEHFKVTPSAVVTRVRRLGLIDANAAASYQAELAREYASRPKQPLSSPLPVNALRKYNGRECSRRMLHLLDDGKIRKSEFKRLMFLDRRREVSIDNFRSAVA